MRCSVRGPRNMASSVFAFNPLTGRRAREPVTPIAPNLNFRNSHSVKFKCEHSCFEVSNVSYQPPGTELSLLNSVSFSLPEKSFGLIFGRSGSGKTTLVQLLAGISKPTSGSIYIQKYGNDGNPVQSPEPLSSGRVGIVFQFPERYFVADNVLDEVTFGWPRQKGDLQMKEHLALRLQRAINWVQVPDLLILDEPLAGLDWKARADVVKLLKHLKKELTILVVSHDLKGRVVKEPPSTL
ncbi:non-intrinsic ABC protein 14 [Prunus dulcis]|uniref:Non-intrinsic ABC protein 14 n=1 Tax=Prunus dulcis TaxID=3755 RepID=A0A4Y1R8P2_PRUDU|nr:non-intrinsic ABC protein 14 [Prunus dulcis]